MTQPSQPLRSVPTVSFFVLLTALACSAEVSQGSPGTGGAADTGGTGGDATGAGGTGGFDPGGGTGGAGTGGAGTGGFTTGGSGGFATGGVGTGGTGGFGAGGTGGFGAGGTGGVGTGGVGTGGTSGGSSELANFATVRQIANLRCGFSDCHATGDHLVLMDDANLYTTLTTHTVTKCGGRTLVQPGTPEQSAFWLVMQGLCEALPRMPNGCVDNCIPQEYIDGVGEWIANGAPQQ